MVIGVNTRFLLQDHLEGVGNFLYQALSRITKDHPEHQFIFIFDRPYDPGFVFGPNVKAVVSGPGARHPLLWKWWYDIKVPAVLKKYKADVFLSCDGFCSLTTKTPQCLVIHDLAFLHYPEFIKKSHLRFYKKNTGKFLEKAKVIATVSEFSKQDILSHYKLPPEKIHIVFNAVRQIFMPIPEDEKSRVKYQYTDGKEFFLYAGAIHPRKNLLNLLKAFSVFKKRQGSNFKLVLAGRLAWKNDKFIDSLKSYKYRDDVVLTGYLNEKELASIMASAYALVYPSLFEGFGVPVLEAMRCAVPVITSAGTSMEEIAGDAALLADPHDHKDIAEKMMRLFKDEDLRKQLIEKGKTVFPRYSWEETADRLWQCILKAVGPS
jgi:glycosyltransferase involved in cell wall biosynthesis